MTGLGYPPLPPPRMDLEPEAGNTHIQSQTVQEYRGVSQPGQDGRYACGVHAGGLSCYSNIFTCFLCDSICFRHFISESAQRLSQCFICCRYCYFPLCHTDGQPLDEGLTCRKNVKGLIFFNHQICWTNYHWDLRGVSLTPHAAGPWKEHNWCRDYL